MSVSVRLFAVSAATALALGSLTSCTTKSLVGEVPPVPEVKAHVIGAEAQVARTIASVENPEVLEPAFQDVLRSENPAARTKEQMDRSIRLFYRTQALLTDYDNKLEQVAGDPNAASSSILTDDSYAKLLAAWSLREEMHAQIRYFYTRTLQVQLEPGNGSQEARDLQNRALVMNSMFKKALVSNATASDKLAKQDLLFDLTEVNKAYADYRRQQAPRAQDPFASVTSLFQRQIIKDPRSLQRFYTKNSGKLTAGASAATLDAELNAQLDARVPEIKQALVDQHETRTPQSSGSYVVGSGPSGMMSGNNFRSGRWSLTFDDGPHHVYTKQVLANLKQYNLKATFFWLAQNVKSQPSLVASVQAAGMDLADHSYSHPQLPKLSASALRREVADSASDEAQVYGSHPKLFRCPYGACGPQNSAVRQMIAQEGMLSVIWNIDSLDWQDKNPASVYARVKKQMAVQKKGIILFHDIHPQSVAASKMVMADLAAGQRSGQLRSLTIQEAMDESNSPGGMQ